MTISKGPPSCLALPNSAIACSPFAAVATA